MGTILSNKNCSFNPSVHIKPADDMIILEGRFSSHLRLVYFGGYRVFLLIYVVPSLGENFVVDTMMRISREKLILMLQLLHHTENLSNHYTEIFLLSKLFQVKIEN